MSGNRAQRLAERHLHEVYVKTDRLMLVILLCQWAFALGLALTISPYGWSGKVKSIHIHVQLAVLLGAVLNAMPVYLILRHPGRWFTRQAVAATQMLWSALLIHLTGGRIETHFHVFGSLAFLAFYRDWRVLPTATAVVVADHLVRGLLWPESVYGIVNPEWWRFLEHAFWVVFEDIVLFLGCRRGAEEISLIAAREASLEELNGTLEDRVASRTAELTDSNEQLEESLRKLQQAQRQLMDASRRAGMAEVATNVLHNVGNVLNSVNVSADVVSSLFRKSEALGVVKLSELLGRQGDDLGRFLSSDPRGKQVPAYLEALAESITAERTTISDELVLLGRNIEHIKTIIGLQQANAKAAGVVERVSLAAALEEAIQLRDLSKDLAGIEVRRDFADLPEIQIDRHRLLQIVMNLLSNARHAILDSAAPARRLTVRTRQLSGERVALEVEDSGCGIAPENLPLIFAHGFTTKKDGHGFGLHSSACAAAELGGSLTAQSDGRGKGARFTLVLPMAPQPSSLPGRCGPGAPGSGPGESRADLPVEPGS